MNFRYILITACTLFFLAACDRTHDHDHDQGHENDHAHQHDDVTSASDDGQTQAFYGDEEAVVIEGLPDHGHGHDHDNGHDHAHDSEHVHDHENGHDHEDDHDHHPDREPHAH